ncbi:hypothetical protein [Raineya orbicola]|uniref:Uncharacterized protein n=1 Tax=Raineya orbicola TaxID=2016530 RepID=A0A2N3IJ28_9BACT|nr:hypothetical protein [Raineya orbicola]PKQ70360.1 hypothetical protein Rain11_0588 [Raineya orbicola]
MPSLTQLNQDLAELVAKRIELSQISYDDTRYDNIEEAVHRLEDTFLAKYDDFLEDVFLDIHDEYCPETEVLSPLAYIARKYVKTHKGFDVAENQGVWVEIEEAPEKEAHLVLLPNPLRVELNIGNYKKIVWQAEADTTKL